MRAAPMRARAYAGSRIETLADEARTPALDIYGDYV
jgi:hypothetical protein